MKFNWLEKIIILKVLRQGFGTARGEAFYTFLTTLTKEKIDELLSSIRR